MKRGNSKQRSTAQTRPPVARQKQIAARRKNFANGSVAQKFCPKLNCAEIRGTSTHFIFSARRKGSKQLSLEESNENTWQRCARPRVLLTIIAKCSNSRRNFTMR